MALVITFLVAILLVFAIRIIANILENKIGSMKDGKREKLFKILYEVGALLILVAVCAIATHISESTEEKNVDSEYNTEQTETTTWWRGLVGTIPLDPSRWRMDK